MSASQSSDWAAAANEVAASIRRRALEVAIRNNGGYLTQASCAAEVLATLYTRLMRLGPSAGPLVPKPLPTDGTWDWGGLYHGRWSPESDRFIVSPAHYATAVYASLIEVGRLDGAALDSFARDGSVLEMIGAEYSPGFEVTTGSLGQGLSVAIGIAAIRQRRADTGRVWVYLSDGEMQEGQTWEALQAGSQLKLANMTVLLDANGFQVDGPIDATIRIEPLAQKVAAFGWDVAEVDGHDVLAIAEAADRAHLGPRFVICRTEPWRGFPSLRQRYPRRLHFIRFAAGEADAALRDLQVVDTGVPS